MSDKEIIERLTAELLDSVKVMAEASAMLALQNKALLEQRKRILLYEDTLKRLGVIAPSSPNLPN